MIQDGAQELERQWGTDDRWSGIERTYTAEDVIRLRGSVVEEHTLARLGSERLWQLIRGEQPVRALGALTGGQAVQMVRAGLEAIYLSGWQVAADANLAGATYPDQSLYPVNSVPFRPSAWSIWSARSSALLKRRTTAGTLFTG